MKFTYNWLQDFVEIKLKPQELADKLTMAGLEVTCLEKFQDDYVFEIEVTSNRPDWLSVIGIAREVAALTGKKLKLYTRSLIPDPRSLKKQKTGIQNQASRIEDPGLRIENLYIDIEDKNACPFYSARLIYDVKVKPSPSWLVKRLQAIGLRSINNIVDITNYILFTTGQPLHAFDLDKLQGKEIHIRLAKNAEELTTIDGIKRKLTPEILIIADKNEPIAIAGIMGGKESEVNEATRNILLESAYFSPAAARRGSRILGLSSDSSYRFERSADKSRVVNSSDLAASLILENADGAIGKLYKVGLDKSPQKVIALNALKANRLLGCTLSVSKIKPVLKALEFRLLSEKNGVLKLGVPDFRQDVRSEIDLIEELCRMYGYENIPLSLAPVKAQEAKEDALLAIQQKLREILAGLGINEVITYSLLSDGWLKKLRVDLENVVRLENPLSMEQEIPRPTLIAGLLNALSRNLELGNKPCAFFEMGNCFEPNGEFGSLGLAIERTTLSELKGKLELCLRKLGIADYKFSENSNLIFKDGRSAALLINDKEVGFIGQFRESILLDFKIDSSEVMAVEINLDKLKAFVNFRKAFKVIPKYPSVMRDLSLIVDENMPYQKILDTIRGDRIEYLEKIKFAGLYRSEAIGKGKKSITISLEFRSPQMTLTDSEVNFCLENIVRALSQELGASIR